MMDTNVTTDNNVTMNPDLWRLINVNQTCGFFSNNCRTEIVTTVIVGTESIPTIATHFNVFILITMVLMDAVGVYINILGIAVLFRSNLPKSTSDLLVVNIAISDTLSAVLVYPVCIMSVAQQHWALGHTTCIWYAFGFPFFGVASINTMASIAAERYLTITKRSQSWRVARLQGFRCVIGVWVSAFLVAVPNIVLLSDSSANMSHLRNGICNLDIDENEASAADILYPIYFLVVCLLVPVCVTTYCYCKLYFMVRLVARRVRISRMSVIAMTVTGTEGTTAPAPGTSAGPQDEVKTERIIAKRMIFMVLVTFLSWLPYSLMEIVTIGLHFRIPLALRILPSVFAKGCIIYNPLIYIAFSKKFKQTFKDYLRCKCGKKSRVQAIRGAAGVPAPRPGGPRDPRMERSSFMRQKTFPLLNQHNMIHETNDQGNGQRYLDPGGNTTSGYGTASLTPTTYLSRTPMPSSSINPSTQVTYLDASSHYASSYASKSPAKVKISLPETQMRTALLLRKDTEETFRYIHDARPQPRRKNGMSTLQVPNLSGLVIPMSHRQIKIDLPPPLPGVPDQSESRDSDDQQLNSKT